MFSLNEELEREHLTSQHLIEEVQKKAEEAERTKEENLQVIVSQAKEIENLNEKLLEVQKSTEQLEVERKRDADRIRDLEIQEAETGKSLRREIAEKTERLERLQMEREELLVKIKSLDENAKQLESLQMELEECKVEIRSREETIEQLQSLMTQCEKVYDNVQESELHLAELEDGRAKIQIQDETIGELRSKVSQLEAVQHELATVNANLEQQKEVLAGQLSTVKMDLSKEKEEKLCLESKFQNLVSIREKLDSEIAEKSVTLEILGSEFDENKLKYEAIKTELSKVCLQLRNLTDVQLPEKVSQMEALQKKCDELTAETMAMESTLKATQNEMSKLSDKKENLERESKQNAVRMGQLETKKAALENSNMAFQKSIVKLEDTQREAERKTIEQWQSLMTQRDKVYDNAQESELHIAELEDGRAKIQIQDETIGELRSKVSQLEAVQHELATVNANLEQQKEVLAGQLSTVKMDLSKEKEEKLCLESKFQNLVSIREKLDSEIAEKSVTLEILGSEFDENKLKYEAIKTELSKVCLQLRNLTDVQLPEKVSQMEALQKKCDELTAETMAMESTLKATQNEMSKLSDEKENLERESEQNAVRMGRLETKKAALENSNMAFQKSIVKLEDAKKEAERKAAKLMKEYCERELQKTPEKTRGNCLVFFPHFFAVLYLTVLHIYNVDIFYTCTNILMLIFDAAI